MPDTAPDISVVISCYFEERSIEEFHTRLSETMQSTGADYEIIYVNDGSADATYEKLHAIYERDPRVFALLDLFRNSGQPAAITAGTNVARGSRILTIDSDLQLDPEDIPALIAKYDEGNDLVCGYREQRSDNGFRAMMSRFVNVVMRRAAGVPLRDFGCNIKLFNATVVRACEFGPFNPCHITYLVAQYQRVAEVPVKHHARRYGRSGWSTLALVSNTFNSVLAMMRNPFQIVSLVCVALLALYFLRIGIYIFLPVPIIADPENSLILNIIVFNLLIILIALALIGEFVMRNHATLQRQPAYVVRTLLRKTEDGDAP